MTRFILISLIVFFCSTCLSTPLQNSNLTVQKPDKRLYNPLVCYVETEGQLYGEYYHNEQRHEPCGPDVKYCQKITAHFIAAGGEVTKILMKGCDTVSVLPHFEGLECKGNGCTERTEGDELYQVCCCNSETCNHTSNVRSSVLVTALVLIASIALV